jgi:hypothetical protein
MECLCDKYFEFAIVINEDPFGKKKLPNKFTEFLADREPAEVTLREATCGLRLLPVDHEGLFPWGRQDESAHRLKKFRPCP